MKRSLLVLALTLCWPSGASAYERLQGPTELLFHNAAKAYQGYTLFGARGTSYLIDMQGNVVKTWPAGTNPRFLENGNLLDASKADPSGFSGFQELDWDGKVVWQYTEKRASYAPHHDWVRIYNPKLKAWTTLYVANKLVPKADAIAAGCDPAKVSDDASMDAVVEVDAAGNVIWEWWFFDHMIQSKYPGQKNYVGAGKAISDYPGRLDINLPGMPLKKDWLHVNAIDYHPTLDQIVINSVQGEFYVIDHGNTFVVGDAAASIAAAAGPKGDFLYRFGDPARYQRGDKPSISENWSSVNSGHKQLGGSHHISWITEGLPGAGHFLIFNNAQYLFERTPQSYVMEINGYYDSSKKDTGAYVDPPAAGYYKTTPDKDTHKEPRNISNQVVWMYSSKSNQAFFSHIGSSAQRLPNGNTLICSDTEGHFFEVTSTGELVWEYINPVTTNGIVTVLVDSLPMTNSVFRAYRYSSDHPALKGRTLTSMGPITKLAGVKSDAGTTSNLDSRVSALDAGPTRTDGGTCSCVEKPSEGGCSLGHAGQGAAGLDCLALVALGLLAVGWRKRWP